MKNFSVIITCVRCGHKEFVDEPEKYDLPGNAHDAGFRSHSYRDANGKSVDVRICRECDKKYRLLKDENERARVNFLKETA